MENPYLVAMYAMKLNSADLEITEIADGISFRSKTREVTEASNVHVMLSPGSLFATSREDALRRGLEWAIELWPKEDGYTCHSVSVLPSRREFLEEGLRALSEKNTDDGSGGSEEWPDVLM
jgi:hypothetical protein